MVVILLETGHPSIRYNVRMPSRYWYLLATVCGIILLVLLKGPLTPSPSVEPTTSTQATSSVMFGDVSLRLEYATTAKEHERGLSGRSSIPEDYGMLFIFPRDDRYGFWMKDTLTPLDIFWLDDKGQVVSMVERADPSSYPTVFYPTAPARYVLETAGGFADAHSIATGTVLELKDLPDVSQ